MSARNTGRFVLATLSVALLGVTACAGLAAPDTDSPAVLVKPDAAARAEVSRVAAELLGQPSVVLADDAFTQTNSVTLEPARPRDASGRLMQGRETRQPERLSLFLRGSRCELVRESTQDRRPLSVARCQAL